MLVITAIPFGIVGVAREVSKAASYSEKTVEKTNETVKNLAVLSAVIGGVYLLNKYIDK